jgi:sialidase-1
MKHLIFLLVYITCFNVLYGNNFEVRHIQYKIPVLMNKPDNTVLVLEVMNNTNVEAEIQEVHISLNGTSKINDIKSVQLFVSEKQDDFSAKKSFGATMSPSGLIVFKDKLKFSGKIFIRVSMHLNNEIDLTNKVKARCSQIIVNSGNAEMVEYQDIKKLRVGVALKQQGEDRVDTYRIPGLTTTNNGTLLAVFDVRYDSYRDLQGNIDIGLVRSTDGGKTWSKMQPVLDMKEWGGLPQKFNGVSDAQILVDKKTNKIFVFGLWMHGVLDKDGRWIEGLTEQSKNWEHQWKNKGSQPGFGVKQTSQFIYTVSEDDGLTWSEPVNITKMGKKEEWWLWAPAPGKGITMNNGTLVITTQGRDGKGEPFSNITFSKDSGKTWITSQPAYTNTTESAVVELSDGSLMLNMRHNDNKNNLGDNNGRAICITKDMGKSWTEHPTSRHALIEPRCMASLHKHEYCVDGVKKSVLVFSNPNSKKNRDTITLKFSFDDGKTWPSQHWILLDEMQGKGYSCITSIDNDNIGILFEGSQAQMTFMQVNLRNILRKP